MTNPRGIIIGGGAFAGLALALALKRGLGDAVPVIVADPALSKRPSRDVDKSASLEIHFGQLNLLELFLFKNQKYLCQTNRCQEE